MNGVISSGTATSWFWAPSAEKTLYQNGLTIPADAVRSMLMLLRGFEAKDTLIRETQNEADRLRNENAILRRQVADCKTIIDANEAESRRQFIVLRRQLDEMEEDVTTLQLQLTEKSELADKLTVQYNQATEVLFQEQQTRTRLEEELLTCQQAAAELREQIQVFLRDVECPLHGESFMGDLADYSSTLIGMDASAWPSPGGESCPVDLSDMQSRLMKYAKLHTPIATPISSP
eukprot:jgi/Botrbrau1/13638/Bobra.0373s0012.1